MEKDRILQTAIRVNVTREQVGERCDSAFAQVHKCIRTAAAESSEIKKKQRLVVILQSFFRGKGKYVDGCKREQLQTIVRLAFGINSGQSSYLRQEIRAYTFQELYWYYCYIERMAKGDAYLIDYLQELETEKRALLAAQKEKKEQEKRRELEEKQEEIEKMQGIERWTYDINERKLDIPYYQELDDETKCNAEKRIAVAQLLKEFWIKEKKWAGDKVFKKQAVRIAKVQEILKEGI